MPEAVLAGANGQPAIDAVTGMPLTMEELLRRRGILSVGGVVSPMNTRSVLPSELTSATGADTALASSADATAANSTGSNTAIGASPNTLDENGLPIGATAATPTLAQEAVPGQPSDDASESDWLAWAAGAGAIGAAAIAAWRMRRNARTATNLDPDGNPGVGQPRNPNYSVNNTLTRVPSDTQGSNQVLSALVDGKKVTNAGQIGAGPKALSGPQPVEDLRRGDTLTSALAERSLPDYYAPGSQPRTRMQQGAAQANASRELPAGNDAILLRDRFSDLDAEERTLAVELAGRMRAAAETKPRLPAKIGQTRVGRRKNAIRSALSQPIRAPADQSSQYLLQAVAEVRRMKAAGLNVRPSAALRRVIP